MTFAQMKLTVPEKIEATLTVRMTIKEWKEFRAGLRDKYPDWDLARAIDDAITVAEKTVWSSGDVE